MTDGGQNSNEVRVEYMALGAIERWGDNPKDHDLGALSAALERFGFVNPMIMDERTGQLVAGHGRVEALRQRKAAQMEPPERVRVEGGEWYVPVIRGIEFADDNEAHAYAVADNRLVERGGWDVEQLTEVLGALAADGGLDGTGYDAADLNDLVGRFNADLGSLETPDEVSGVVGSGSGTGGAVDAEMVIRFSFGQFRADLPFETYEAFTRALMKVGSIEDVLAQGFGDAV